MTWQDLLRKKAALLSDGAWGTELAARGLPPGHVPELWNAECPGAVEAVARAYVEAGSDIILTNTFGGTPWKLEKVGLAARTAELNRLGVEISRRAAAGRALVFASIGPTGEFVAPLGTRTDEEFVACFAEQIAACVAGGADGLCIESFSALDEATAALRAARQVCSLPVVVSLTFTKGPRGYATMMGVRPDQAAAALDAAGADLIGANCGAGIEQAVEIARLLRPATRRPLWIKPNAGLPELVDGQTVFRQSPADMAARVRDLLEAGASVLGGCCGSTPAHLRALAAALDTLRPLARSLSRDILETL
jgi:5-methyltetrahydrofolate--homocysteine methyltransferase